jgi:hypothetical protein
MRLLTATFGVLLKRSSQTPFVSEPPDYERYGTAGGLRFEQNAIVWTGLDAVPELVLLR